jgi:hypothetical protein
MSLHFMVDSAKKHEPVRQSTPVSRQKIIGADDDEPAIPTILQADPNLWTKCSCLKQAGGRDFCTQFLALCAKTKCPPKVMKIDYSKLTPPGSAEQVSPLTANGDGMALNGNGPAHQNPAQAETTFA